MHAGDSLLYVFVDIQFIELPRMVLRVNLPTAQITQFGMILRDHCIVHILIGTDRLPADKWAEIKQRTIKGGANIINLRGRSSFQSPAYVSVRMIEAAMGGAPFNWPAGRYVSFAGYDHIMMAMEATITKNGSAYEEIHGTPEEMAELRKSYEHLCNMRDEVIGLGVMPPVEKWGEINPNLK